MTAINYGSFSEALNDKTDRDLKNVDIVSGADAIVAYQLPTAANSYTWFRLYASGWVEQGGITEGTTTITVDLPITMFDENYAILTQSYQAEGYYSSWTVRTQSVTDSQFILQTDYSGLSKVIWEAKGMIHNS